MAATIPSMSERTGVPNGTTYVGWGFDLFWPELELLPGITKPKPMKRRSNWSFSFVNLKSSKLTPMPFNFKGGSSELDGTAVSWAIFARGSGCFTPLEVLLLTGFTSVGAGKVFGKDADDESVGDSVAAGFSSATVSVILYSTGTRISLLTNTSFFGVNIKKKTQKKITAIESSKAAGRIFMLSSINYFVASCA